MPWSISLKGPAVLAALGFLVALVAYPNAEPSGPFFLVAFLWVMFTARSRRIYRDAFLRSRARRAASQALAED